ncbi:response regulator transcription factor [Pseudomonas matsuisoli]|uniref:Response regulator n=1 Tax=Pseudomonas matsuisoli TaxID=1515666 RepID=A0A917PQX3_9PSED|nr:response regulator [Pseudomonas matsuisoli]GGJ87694.1 response regulator [Pseudomonas matsuisoli]
MDTVCVIDDELAVRKAVVNLLKSEGYDAISFSSGESLLEFDGKHAISCLLMDLNMPGLTGRETYGQLLSAGYQIPIIYMTAETDGQDAAALTKVDSVRLLAKPFTAEALLRALRAIA